MLFNKYEGTGNDFIIIDNRNKLFISEPAVIERLCNRRFGIGADGLILVEKGNSASFRMRYFNADGHEASMCGNGGRCTAHYAFSAGIAPASMDFNAADGIHHATVNGNIVTLSMSDVKNIVTGENSCFLDTGSPHLVCFVDDPEKTDVVTEGRKMRYSEKYSPDGTNVNFVAKINNKLIVRTYERGVEDETLSCGTGVTASAIASFISGHFDSSTVSVLTRGGNLTVSFSVKGTIVSDIQLTGPVSKVFTGEINL